MWVWVCVRACELVQFSFFLNEFTWTFMLMHAENHPNSTSSRFFGRNDFPSNWSYSCVWCCSAVDAASLQRQYANTNNANVEIQSNLRSNNKKLDFNSTHTRTKQKIRSHGVKWAHTRANVCARAREREKDLSGGKICEYKKKNESQFYRWRES